jgi:hypothetical protein
MPLYKSEGLDYNRFVLKRPMDEFETPEGAVPGGPIVSNMAPDLLSVVEEDSNDL